MNLRDYLELLRRRWLIISIVLLSGIGGAAAVTLLQTPEYRTSAQFLIRVADPQETGAAQSTFSALQTAKSFSGFVGTPPVVASAVEAAGSTGPSVAAEGSVAEDQPFLSVTVTSTDPAWAAAVANAYEDSLLPSLTELGQSTSGASLTVLAAAGVPTEPASPRPEVNLAIGLLIGLLLALAAAFVRDNLDRRLQDSGDVESEVGVTVLGVVPAELMQERLPAATHPQSLRSEAYRRIRANLLFATSDGMPRSVMVTSAVAGEGKSTVAANLAVTCARAGQNVVLVDADLRRPMIASLLGVGSYTGLTDVLTGVVDLDAALQPIPELRFTVLTSGPISDSPSELLGSEALVMLVEELEERFDVVVIDTAPVLPVADALQIGVQTAGVMVVTRVGATTRDSLRQAINALEQVNATVLGVVSNAVMNKSDSAYRGYGQYSSVEPMRSGEEIDLRPATSRGGTRRRQAPHRGGRVRGL